MPTPAELQRTSVNPPDHLPGYDLFAAIGVGEFGTVFKARQLALDRVVAVKVLRAATTPEQAERFEAEAVTLGRLRHPNVVQVFDAGRHGDRAYLAMEFLEGEDFERLVLSGRADEPLAWAVARQAAAGLEHAAALGVVHRDVKPANLFLVPPPTGFDLPPGMPMVKVTDFGLATTRGGHSQGGVPGRGWVFGSPAYMAPEQHRGDALDHRADIYALGATVFYALTGRPPFPGPTTWDLLERKLAGPPSPGPKVSKAGAELLAAMMAPDPAERIGTYRELLARIDALELEPPRTRRYSPPLWATAAVVVAATVVGIAYAATRPGGRPESSAFVTLPPGAYTRGGDDFVLFDMRSLAGWLPPASGGVWHVEGDDEHDRVLAGTGFLRRAFPAAADYRITLGLDVHKAAAAEVHFAIPARSPEAGPWLVLRVSRAEGAVLGTRDGDRGAFRPLTAAVPFPPQSWFDGRRPYLEVKVERAGGYATVAFNGTAVGRHRADGEPKAPELRLFADGGPARVDSVTFVQLRPK